MDSKLGTDFLEAIAESVAQRLLPRVIEHFKSETVIKEDITMDVNEAASYIGISPEMLYKLCSNKLVPHIPLSSTGRGRPRILFSSASIDAWKKERERENYQPYQVE